MASNARRRSETALAFASQIRAERAAKGWTQEQLGSAAGISRSQMIRIESGDRVADVSQIAAICEALGVSFVEFARRAENRARFDAQESERRAQG